VETVDLVFPVCGSGVPAAHQYPLYGGLSRLLPCLHDGSLAYALAALTGRYVGDNWLQLDPRSSRLRIRLAATDIPRALPLAGKGLTVLGRTIRLGVPHVEALRPAANLIAHVVTIKNATEPETFLAAARKKLDAVGVGGRAEIPPVPSGPRRGQPRRQVLRVKKSTMIGYALRVNGLSPEESVRLQTASIRLPDSQAFGRKHMGGGFFLPASGEDGHE
jgi:CRISPR-associated endonuclease/helicase Cas3